jgi:hypothetical protein
MKKIKATCETENCSQKGITHEFLSDVEQTMCGLCSQSITNLVIEEVTDESEEIAPVVEVVVEEEPITTVDPIPEEVTDGTHEEAE